MRYASLFLLHILFAFGLTHSVLGQNTVVTDRIDEEADRAPLSRIEKAADKALRDGDHYSAMVYYRRLLRYDSTNVPVLRNYAEAAMKFSALDSAAWAYQRLVALNALGSDGLPVLRLAEIKYRHDDFGEAKLDYERFLLEKPAGVSNEAFAEAARQLEICKWAESVADNTDLASPVTPVREFNSPNPEISEYSPYPLGDKVYFSSYRFPYPNDRHNPERRSIQVIEATPGPDSMVLRKADEFNMPVNRDQQHTAHVTFNTDRTAMYCSVCKFVNSTDIQCALYVRKREGNGWGKAVRLPNSINMPGFTTTEPSVGRAPDTQGDVLYFVSDRPNGKGKRDIWYSNIMADSFSHPINAGIINSAGDDLTPFYHSNSGVLYFSTEGRTDGLRTVGGLDIYKATGQRSSWAAPEHMGVPINTGYNDAFFSLTDDSQTAYLISNRDTTKGDESCCYDIYRATLVKPKALVQICEIPSGNSNPYGKSASSDKSYTSGKPLYYSTVRLIELTPGGSKEVKMELGNAAEHDLELMTGRKYRLIASRDRYTTDTLDFETPRTLWKEPIVKKLCLTQAKICLVVQVFDKEIYDKQKRDEPINGATVRFRDYGSAKADGTKPLAKTETHPNDNTYFYALDFEHTYRASATKAGYTSDSTEIVSTIGLTTLDTIRRKVYLMRGVNFRGWALNKLTRDTLYGVTFNLTESQAAAGAGKDKVFTNALGEQYQTIVGFEKRYNFSGSKPGFTSGSKPGQSYDSAPVNTVGLAPKPFQEVTGELLLLPLDLEAYLPIKLYFDNDEPDKNTLAKTTTRQYQPTYIDYYRRKKEFTEVFTAPLSGAARQQATDSLEVFFEREVKRDGWDRLFAFSEALYAMMERGDSIVLTLRGFASPLAKSNYNLNLTSRRVSSVHNHFDKFDGGVYKRFVDNGQLVIELAPMGETKIGSDDFRDKRRSVFSVEASRQRRLEIIGVEVNKEKKEMRKVPRK